MRATLENFGPFRTEATLSLNEPGLVYLTGDNRMQPRLGANGVGKSSLFNAIYWCLYGKTSRGLKGQALRSWGSTKTCSVKVELNDEVTVTRTLKPNALTLNGAPVDQERVTEAVGLSEDEFLHSVYFSQFEPKFVDLRPTAQLELFSRVMGLEVWERASERAAEATRELEREAAVTEQEVARTEGRIEVLQLEADQARDMSAAWKQTQQAEVETRAEELRKLEAELNHAKRRAAKKLPDARALREAAHKARAELTQALKHQEHVNGMQAVCPYCEQAITASHCEELRRTASAELETAQRAFNSAQAKALAAEEAAEEQRRDEMAVRDLDLRMRGAEKALKDKERETDPYKEQAARAVSGLKKAKADGARLSTVLRGLLKRAELTRHWIKGFRDVRLWLVDDTLAQLEVEVNGALHAMGMEGWAITFDVERETKAGGVSRGFTVAVQSPDVSEAVPWEAWSGGESQRLRLACTVGMANLICARRGVDLGVEFWDEPSAWLSDEGIDDMLRVLEERAADRAVVVAEHRALGYGGFTRTLRVVKDKRGSTVNSTKE